MSNTRRSFFALALALAAVDTAGARGLEILQHESIAIREQAADAAGRRVSFEAYGRRFDMRLRPNERVRRGLPPGAGAEPFQGEIENAPGSWVRLTRIAGRWQGMFSDGREVYAIESAADIAPYAVQPLAKSGESPVVYRLADALLPLGAGFCAALPAGEKTTALQALESLGGAAEAATAESATLVPTRQLDVGVVADYELLRSFGTEINTRNAIVARMNIVDGIFSAQLGVKIAVPSIEIHRTADDPFTATAAGDLLDQLRKYRSQSPEQMGLGLSHLMTGRDLQGDTVGIAYIGSVCGGQYSVSLSEGARSITTAALVAAHEIGHNFNAPHDGEPGPCEAEPWQYLMAPRLNGSDRFSACSLREMQPTLARAQCLAAPAHADARLGAVPPELQAAVNSSFALAFSIEAAGTADSAGVAVTVDLPTALDLDSADAAGGSCSSGAGTVTCTLGTVPAGESRGVELALTPRSTGTFTVAYTVSSQNDAVAGNNAGQTSVKVGATAPPTQPGTSGPDGGAGAGGGGSGGGGFPGLEWLALALALGARCARTMRPNARR